MYSISSYKGKKEKWEGFVQSKEWNKLSPKGKKTTTTKILVCCSKFELSSKALIETC